MDSGIWCGGERDSGNMRAVEILCTPSEWDVSFSCRCACCWSAVYPGGASGAGSIDGFYGDLFWCERWISCTKWDVLKNKEYMGGIDLTEECFDGYLYILALTNYWFGLQSWRPEIGMC